jgi:hypothetical protein
MNKEPQEFICKTIMYKEITRKNDIANIVTRYKESNPESLVTTENVTAIISCCPSKYVFYLDIDNEYNWEVTDAYWDLPTDDEKKERNAILSNIAQEQHVPAVKYLDKKSKKSYQCLLGESHFYAFIKNFEGAENHLEYAKKYIKNRKIEISRKWQLSFCLLILLVIFAVQFIIYTSSTALSSWFSAEEAMQNLRYITAGVLGATLSIILKSGKQSFNCESGRWLNFLEVVSKMIAAGISCFIIILLFKLDLVFTGLKDNYGNEVLYLLCIMAGFSERLIPSILQKIESKEVQEENKNKT